MLLTPDELAAIRNYHQRNIYLGNQHWNTITKLLAHVDAQQAEIERLNAELDDLKRANQRFAQMMNAPARKPIAATLAGKVSDATKRGLE